MKKTALVIWNAGNRGKTESVRAFASALLAAFPGSNVIYPTTGATIPTAGDFRLVVQIKGKIVAIESQGDPYTDLQKRLLEIDSTFKCDVLICTSRTRGETVYAVEHLAHHRNYELIWSSTYQVPNQAQQAPANQLKGKHMLDLLLGLGII